MRTTAVASLLKAMTVFGSGQVAVQGLAFASGLLLVRLLSIEQYALFTIANALGSTMLVLSDCGVSASVASQCGKVIHDQKKVGAILSAGRTLRYIFAAPASIIILPALLYMLGANHASAQDIALLSACSILSLINGVTGNMLAIPLLLHQTIRAYSTIVLAQNAFRLALVGAFVTALPAAWVALLTAIVPQSWANLQLKKVCKRLIEFESPADNESRTITLNFVKRAGPSSLYYCVSGQVTIFLISFFGTTQSVAEVGAIGRLTMLITLVAAVINGVLVSRFTTLPLENGHLFKRFLQIITLTILVGCGIVAMFAAFSDVALWILGPKYHGLSSELTVLVSTSCIVLLSGICQNLGMARGWLVSPALAIPIAIGGQLMLIPFINFSDVHQVLLFGLISSIFTLAVHLVYVSYKCFQSSPR